jgi:hypothetical protein
MRLSTRSPRRGDRWRPRGNRMGRRASPGASTTATRPPRRATLDLQEAILAPDPRGARERPGAMRAGVRPSASLSTSHPPPEPTPAPSRHFATFTREDLNDQNPPPPSGALQRVSQIAPGLAPPPAGPRARDGPRGDGAGPRSARRAGPRALGWCTRGAPRPRPARHRARQVAAAARAPARPPARARRPSPAPPSSRPRARRHPESRRRRQQRPHPPPAPSWRPPRSPTSTRPRSPATSSTAPASRSPRPSAWSATAVRRAGDGGAAEGEGGRGAAGAGPCRRAGRAGDGVGWSRAPSSPGPTALRAPAPSCVSRATRALMHRPARPRRSRRPPAQGVPQEGRRRPRQLGHVQGGRCCAGAGGHGGGGGAVGRRRGRGGRPPPPPPPRRSAAGCARPDAPRPHAAAARTPSPPASCAAPGRPPVGAAAARARAASVGRAAAAPGARGAPAPGLPLIVPPAPSLHPSASPPPPQPPPPRALLEPRCAALVNLSPQPLPLLNRHLPVHAPPQAPRCKAPHCGRGRHASSGSGARGRAGGGRRTGTRAAGTRPPQTVRCQRALPQTRCTRSAGAPAASTPNPAPPRALGQIQGSPVAGEPRGCRRRDGAPPQRGACRRRAQRLAAAAAATRSGRARRGAARPRHRAPPRAPGARRARGRRRPPGRAAAAAAAGAAAAAAAGLLQRPDHERAGARQWGKQRRYAQALPAARGCAGARERRGTSAQLAHGAQPRPPSRAAPHRAAALPVAHTPPSPPPNAPRRHRRSARCADAGLPRIQRAARVTPSAAGHRARLPPPLARGARSTPLPPPPALPLHKPLGLHLRPPTLYVTFRKKGASRVHGSRRGAPRSAAAAPLRSRRATAAAASSAVPARWAPARGSAPSAQIAAAPTSEPINQSVGSLTEPRRARGRARRSFAPACAPRPRAAQRGDI